MLRSEIFSLFALGLSTISLSFSAYFGLRDRGRLRTTSRFVAASEFGSARVEVTLINTGRRTIILQLLGGSDEDGIWAATGLGDGKSGLRLGEHERHEILLEKDDLAWFHPEKDDEFILFKKLWVEDSLGRRYSIHDAKSNIKKYRAAESVPQQAKQN